MISKYCAIFCLIRKTIFSLRGIFRGIFRKRQRRKRIRGRIDRICQLDEGLFSRERQKLILTKRNFAHLPSVVY